MNLKYQKNGQKDSDCVYEGRAEIVTKDPSALSASFLYLLYFLIFIRTTNFIIIFFFLFSRLGQVCTHFFLRVEGKTAKQE
jgi:hypothetical protein